MEFGGPPYEGPPGTKGSKLFHNRLAVAGQFAEFGKYLVADSRRERGVTQVGRSLGSSGISFRPCDVLQEFLSFDTIRHASLV